MADTSTPQKSPAARGFGRYLIAGLLAAAAAVVLNNVIYLLLTIVGGFRWDLLTAVSILGASLLPNLLAALAYFGLARLTRRPRLYLTAGVLVFVLVSIAPHLGIGPPPSPALAALPAGFDLVTIPLHIVFGLTAILIIPWAVKSE